MVALKKVGQGCNMLDYLTKKEIQNYRGIIKKLGGLSLRK